jgi:hypothetical protein
MPTIAERLRHVTSKVERAKKHISDLQVVLSAFLQSEPYKISAKHYPKTRKLVYYVADAKPIPSDLALIAGDIVQNLMSALDHLAYQLVCSDTDDAPPNPDWIYFPIRNSLSEYEARKNGKMQGAKPETFAAIDLLKPYKGGNDLLWSLYRLNNIEKHRLLFTVGCRSMVNIGGMIAPHMAKDGALAGFTAASIATFFGHLWIGDSSFPLEAGSELYIGAPDEEIDPNLKFRFDVAFNEAGVSEGKPILETLHQLTTLVEGIIGALMPRLK